MNKREQLLQKLLEQKLTEKGVNAPTAMTLPRADREAHARIEDGQRLVVVPASFEQELMWLNARFDADGSFYNVALELDLRGPLHVDALEAAIRDLVNRHEVLRARLVLEEGVLVQKIAPTVDVPVERASIAELPEAEKEPELRRRATAFVGVPIDPSTGPLLKAQLVTVAEKHHVLLLVVHHVATDGWSARILFRDLGVLYGDRAAGRAPSLPPLQREYTDFAAWQRGLPPERLEASLEYWRKQLTGAPRSIALPKLASAKAERVAEHVTVTLPKSTVDGLEALRAKEGQTRFVWFLAPLYYTLHRWSDQSDLVVGTAHANRRFSDIEEVLGSFVNFVALRTRIAHGMTFREFVADVGEMVRAGLAKVDCPFAKVVANLTGEKGTTTSPWDVFLLFADYPVPTAPPDSDVKIEMRQFAEPRTAAVGLRFLVEDHGAGLSVTLEYDTSVYMRSHVERILSDYVDLLGTLPTRMDQRLGTTDCLAPSERTLVLADPNESREPFPASTLYGRFLDAAKKHPENVAVACGDQRFTYRELLHRASNLAAKLVALGVGPEDLVAISSARSADLITAIVGVLASGAAYVPIDPSYPESRVLMVLEDSRPKVLVTDDALRTRVPAGTAVLEYKDFSSAETAPAAPRAAPDHPAYVIYTSGSTGRPKGVVITHRQGARLFDATTELMKPTSKDVWTLFHSYAFDFSVWEIWGALFYGGTVVVVPREVARSTQDFIDLMRREKVTVLSQTPSAFQRIVELDTGGLDAHLRMVIFGGEALDYPALRPWYERYKEGRPHLVNMYGITETTVHVTRRHVRVEEVENGGLSLVGRGIDDLYLRVLDSCGRPLPRGVAGELYVGGAGLARGYLHRPDLTADRFVPDPFAKTPGARLYRTGDLVRLREDLDVEYLGRIDHQVKIRGFRIELGEIEAALSAVPGVNLASCVPQGVGILKRLVGFVRVTDKSLTPEAVREHVAKSLPEHAVPSWIAILDEFPMTPSGKVDRRALETVEVKKPTEQTRTAPKTPTETVLVDIWKRVLGVAELGTEENFFDLGGHSLLAVQIANEVGRTLRATVPLKVLFEHPTVASLSSWIDAQGQAEPLATMPQVVSDPAHAGDPFPLSEVQQAYWVGRSSEITGGGVACHAYFEFELNEVDLERLRSAWKTLVWRHPMLRAVVDEDGQQRVLSDVPDYVMTIEDVGTGPDAEAKLLATRDRLSHIVHDSARFPLFELSISRMGPERARLHFSFDLLLGDATSIAILGSELLSLYAHPDVALPPIGITFRDYILAEQAFQKTALYKKSERYWFDRLATFPSAPELPLATSPTNVGKPTFTRREREMAPEAWARAKARLAEEAITPAAFLLSVYAHTLAHFSRNRHFALTLTLFNRLPFHPDVDSIVGDFTSLTLLEIDSRKTQSFRELAKSVQARLVEDLDHRHVGGIRVLRELARARGDAASSLPVIFTSMMGLQQVDPGEDAADLMRRFSDGYAITQTPQVWIDHQAAENDGRLKYNWDCIDELFPPGLLGTIFEVYGALLDRFCSDASAWGAELTTTLPPAQAKVRQERNATEAPISSTLLHELVLSKAASRADALAVIGPEVRLTHGALEAHAHVLAKTLREAGAVKNQLVAIVMDKGWEQIAAALGILVSGAAYLPIDAQLPQERVRHILEHAKVSIVVTQPAVKDRYRWSDGVRVIELREGDEKRWDGSRAPFVQTPTDLAYVIYTSGSTGLPKGVMIDHRGAVNTILDVNEKFGVSASDRVLGLSSMSFDLSVWDVFGVIGAGGAVVLPDTSRGADPLSWADLVEREQVTLWNTVPALMGIFVDALGGGLATKAKSLRLCMMSGDWIPLDLPERIAKVNDRIKIVSLGGATEASIWSIYYPVSKLDADWPSVPYGWPMKNQRWYVLDERLEDRPDFVAGELYIGGIGVALGYLNDEGRTNERFLTHPRTGERIYKTGNLGRYHPDGTIEFLGREDAQVKIQGFRIELGEIEAALAAHPKVKEATVCAAGEKLGAKRLVAFYVPHDSAGWDGAVDELRAFLHERIPPYMVPPSFVRVDAIPLSSNGKVDRKALLALEDQARSVVGESEAPENAVEEVLVAIWAEALELDELGVTDNLFERGADSVHAARVTHRVREMLGAPLSLRELFLRPTIRAMASKLMAVPQVMERAALILDVASEEEEEEGDGEG